MPNKNATLLLTTPFKSYTGGVIVIEATIDNNTQPLNFILDTGSSGISLDSTTCNALNIIYKKTDTTVTGIGGAKKVSFAFNRQLKIGSLVTDSLNFYINDYSLLGSVYGEKIDGIIGYSFLSRYILEINFDSAHIKIYSPGKFKYKKNGFFFTPNFARLASYPLTIKDKEKIAANFYLDTGAGLCLLLTDQFIKDHNILLKRRKSVLANIQGLGGKKTMRLTVVKSLKFGPYVFRNVPTNLYNDEVNITSYPYTSGLLGNDIMRRFNVTINYPANQWHIIPNLNFNDHFDYAYTGLSMYNFADKIYIDDIIDKSPAQKAGLKNGDEIISVSTNFSGNIQVYETLLQKAKEKVLMIIKRDGKIYLIQLYPVSIL